MASVLSGERVNGIAEGKSSLSVSQEPLSESSVSTTQVR